MITETSNTESLWSELGDYIDMPARERIERLARDNNQSLPVTIAQLGLAPDHIVVTALQKVLGIDAMSLDACPEDPIDVPDLSPQFLKARGLLPVSTSNNRLWLAMVDPMDKGALRGVSFATGYDIKPCVISVTDWRDAFNRLYGRSDTGDGASTGKSGFKAGWADDATRLKDMASEAPVIRRVEQLLTKAVDMKASDIHVEPAPNQTRVRFRVDGQILPPRPESPELAALIASRVKVMCDMDVADRRRPQDGRTSTAVRGCPIDLRVSTVPTVYGESLAIRLLDRSASLLDMETLGFSEHDLGLITNILDKPKGIFLVTGPTGSGKTTTLYAGLNRLRRVARKILTVEDPIEYFFDDVNQVQVNDAAGVTFSSALRSFLRQDPDIMMVGEIRDGETARIAVQAALTGHLVLSTLHTNDAVSAIARLKDMGIEDYLIAATLSGVTAQRLVRRLCPDCRKPVKNAQPKHYRMAGCKTCEGDGFRGRTLISEGFRCSSDIATLIRDDAGDEQIFAAVLSQGMTPMLEDGLAKAAQGLVVLDDVYAAVGRG